MSDKLEAHLAALQTEARAWAVSPAADAAFARLAEQIAKTSEEIQRIGRIDPELRHRKVNI